MNDEQRQQFESIQGYIFGNMEQVVAQGEAVIPHVLSFQRAGEGRMGVSVFAFPEFATSEHKEQAAALLKTQIQLPWVEYVAFVHECWLPNKAAIADHYATLYREMAERVGLDNLPAESRTFVEAALQKEEAFVAERTRDLIEQAGSIGGLEAPFRGEGVGIFVASRQAEVMWVHPIERSPENRLLERPLFDPFAPEMTLKSRFSVHNAGESAAQTGSEG